ncbi:hypothetical protein IM792_09245 [Mucilaginibacter sp. JRF]|uniref:hypothetical protein n=1 Tax=Mucilaginibacter sp. JRF TaxID=2780088 RepID=UPI0018803087|nr:hypothetical protein [Mucilaginibacter sp. JRF]MBE9584629.1 hypothetical protein [Mucilaginibacter sp. JRF]
MDNTIDNRLSDALFLLSRDNHWDALKIAYEILINEVFLFAKKTRNYKQHQIEEKGKDMLCVLHNMLIIKRVKNIYAVLHEVRLLTIFFNNYSRETLTNNITNSKVKVLALNLIGLVKFLKQVNDNSSYSFGMIDSALIDEIQNNVTEEIYSATTPYFQIKHEIYEYFQKDFWNELESFNPNVSPLTIIDTVTYESLLLYRNLLDEHQLMPSKIVRDDIEEIWKTTLNVDEVSNLIKNQYYLLNVYNDLESFRKSDIQSGKSNKNTYINEKEHGFHKTLYPYLTNCSTQYDLVLSEQYSAQCRYDIVLYKSTNDLSAILELKVNDLSNITHDLNQLIEYLNGCDEKHYHFMKEPSVGALIIYYVGKKAFNTLNVIELLTEYPNIVKISSNFYVYFNKEQCEKPILISILNGKEK